jgi:hypothetical protein
MFNVFVIGPAPAVYGVETLVIDDESREEMEEYLGAVNGESPP